MKRSITVTCFFFLIIAVISLFLSSDATAYDPKKDLASSMNLTAAGPMSKHALSALRTTKEDNTLGAASIPVGEGISTYMDCGEPLRHDLGTQVITTDFRTVIGFQFILK